jgi:acyl-CoA reductase-like NAD-dependent aldehyde dehydrogenase
MADPLRLVETYPLYIDGQWIERRNGRYDDISPSTEETIAQAPEADVDDVDAADERAHLQPTILTDVSADSRIAQEEVFGPVLTVLRYSDDNEAVAIANNSQYGLSGAVWGADVDCAVAVARRVRTGQIAVNGCIPGDAPFGGFKQSGLGREGGGLPGLHRYMEPKAIGIPA